MLMAETPRGRRLAHGTKTKRGGGTLTAQKKRREGRSSHGTKKSMMWAAPLFPFSSFFCLCAAENHHGRGGLSYPLSFYEKRGPHAPFFFFFLNPRRELLQIRSSRLSPWLLRGKREGMPLPLILSCPTPKPHLMRCVGSTFSPFSPLMFIHKIKSIMTLGVLI